MIGPAPTGPLASPTEDAELHSANTELAEWQRQQQQAIGEYDAIYEYLRAKGEIE